ncbi:uncharacterized protein LOC122078066 [Macadamia integrifolia]|uniref:uncharacterized protein LOC122078066 n=1 Tax=Macadamia integrifolia TaxID=60698 RepID=UPI001C4F2895|nr:uncharacterized protein LOC122078066 [Macadamia integrifolia]
MATTTILLSTATQAIRPVGKVGKVATMAEWCNNTDTPDLCNSIMKNTKFGTCEQATRSAINGTMVEINGGIAKIETLVETTEGQIKSLLEGCKEQYNFAIDDLNNALNQIQVDQSELMNSLSAVESYVQTCADGFSDFSMTNPIGHVNGLLDQLSSVNLALATNLPALED